MLHWIEADGIQQPKSLSIVQIPEMQVRSHPRAVHLPFLRQLPKLAPCCHGGSQVLRDTPPVPSSYVSTLMLLLVWRLWQSPLVCRGYVPGPPADA